ncbi:MAG: alpha/beta hydrolase [Frankiales bacterium]|nr:alpha/beta hydrolase [Frankiales bacterium]
MRLRVPAIVGGAVGAVGLVTAAAAAAEHRQVSKQRQRIDPRAAASFGALPTDRNYRVAAEDGVSLYVEEVGPLDAPLTVVFAHGFTLALGSYHFQRLALEQRFGDRVRLVFFDQRSHGRSEKSPSLDCTIEQTGRDLAAVLDASAPTGPIALVGHSMGGMTVISLAEQLPARFHPDGRIRAVALINTSSGGLREVTLGLPSLVAKLRGPVLPMVLRRAAKSVALVEAGRALGKDLAWIITKRLSFAAKDVDPAVVAYSTRMISSTPVDVVAAFYPSLMSYDGSLGLMNLVGCRALVIGGEDDSLTPVAHSEMIAASLPAATFIAVPDTGHLLMLERPDAVDLPLIGLIEQELAELGLAPPVGAGRRR